LIIQFDGKLLAGCALLLLTVGTVLLSSSNHYWENKYLELLSASSNKCRVYCYPLSYYSEHNCYHWNIKYCHCANSSSAKRIFVVAAVLVQPAIAGTVLLIENRLFE
jgi:hypothetical protein